MTQNDKPDPASVDVLLARARDTEVQLPPDLAQRVVADALNVQPQVPAAPRRPGWGQRFLAALGGWPALGGLAAASCTGFWIGISPPEGMIDAGALLVNASSSTVYDEAAELTAFGWDVEEG